MEKPDKDPRRQGRMRWSRAKAERFLAELEEAPNIVRAAHVVGVSKTTVYNKRGEDADFAARWDEALARGWDRLDNALLEYGLSTFEGRLGQELARSPMTVRDAVALLNRNSLKAQRNRVTARAADIEAARASIVKKVAAVKRARKPKPSGDASGIA